MLEKYAGTVLEEKCENVCKNTFMTEKMAYGTKIVLKEIVYV